MLLLLLVGGYVLAAGAQDKRFQIEGTEHKLKLDRAIDYYETKKAANPSLTQAYVLSMPEHLIKGDDGTLEQDRKSTRLNSSH